MLAGEQVVPTDVQVQNKWKALVNTYKKYTDESNKSGSGRRAEPAYYEELSEIYGYRPNVKPFITVDSGSSQIKRKGDGDNDHEQNKKKNEKKPKK